MSGEPEIGPLAVGAVGVDRFLGGRFAVVQPLRGHHRAGHDAVLLAAAVPAGAAGTVVDLGAGVGTAGFAVAVRCPGVSVILAEIDPLVAGCARAGLALADNAAFADRVRVVEVDVTGPAGERRAVGLAPGMASAVILNPPFHAAGAVRASPEEARARAHVLGPSGFDGWLRAAADLAAPDALVAAIVPAAALATLIAAAEGRFGALAITPVYPRADAAAIRVVVRGRKGSRAPLSLTPGLVLHAAGSGDATPEAEAILRGGAELAGGG